MASARDDGDDVGARLPGTLQATFWPAGRLPGEGHMAWWGTDDPERDAAELQFNSGAGPPAVSDSDSNLSGREMRMDG